jgi:hypothetical protein
MQRETVQREARKLVEDLPESATWEDLMYRIYVRKAIEAGLEDSDQSRTVDIFEVRKGLFMTV